jgi:hypothetical protein
MKAAVTQPARPKRFAAERLEQRITIERGGRVTARSGKVEYGQGIRTGRRTDLLPLGNFLAFLLVLVESTFC